MVTPCAGIHLGRAAELAQCEHERVLQRPAAIQIGDERRHTAIKLLAEVALERLKNRRVMVPATGVNRHPGNARFNEPAGQQAALAEIGHAIHFPCLRVLLADIESRLRLRTRDEVHALGIELVKTHGRILRCRIRYARQPVQGFSQILTGYSPALTDVGGKHHVTDLEAFRLRRTAHDERRVLRAEEIRPAGARHARHGHVGRHALLHSALVGNHGTKRRMKGHEGTAAHRHGRRRTGHQVVVATAVIGILVRQRAKDGTAVRDLGQFRNTVGKMDTGNARLDGLEFPANLRRRVRLRVEALIMTGAAILPDHDDIHALAAWLAGCLGGFRCPCAEPQQIGEAQARSGTQAELEEVAAPEAGAVVSRLAHVCVSCWKD